MKPSDGGNAGIDTESSRCVLYLLGELDEVSERQFEQDLSGSSDLHRELLSQAELILALGQVGLPTVVPGKHVARSTVSSTAQGVRRRVMAVASVAACLLVAVVSIRLLANGQGLAFLNDLPSSKSTKNLDESWQIAQAWGAGQLEPEVQGDEFAVLSSDIAIDLTDDESTVDFDSTLSWMIAAIASSPELRSPEANDG